jgi:hypothetical protein
MKYLALLLIGCSAPAPQPPCDPSTLVAITADCSVAAFDCGKAGVPEEQCTEETACLKRLDDRQAVCK